MDEDLNVDPLPRRLVHGPILGLFVAMMVLPAAARAQGNYRAVPTGGRSALMGNTGVALARDGSAPFLNPAAIASVLDSRVAFSVNFYSLTLTTVDGLHSPRDDRSPIGGFGGTTPNAIGGKRLVDATVDALPSTFCLFLSLGEEKADVGPRRKLAVCAGTSERRALAASDGASGRGPDGQDALHLASLDRSYGRVHVGPTYGENVSERLALGASLHLVDTRVTSLTTADATSVDTSSRKATTSAFSSAISATSFDLALLLGATLRVDRATTLGLAFGLPSLHVTSTADAAEHAQHAGGNDHVSRTNAGSGRFVAPLPMRVAVGVGTRSRRLSIEADATYFFPTDAFRAELDSRSVTTRRDAIVDDASARTTATTHADGVLDSALGAELFVSESIGVLAGVAADFGAIRRLSTGAPFGTIATSREDRAIASLGVGSYGGGSELLFGVQLAVARGELYAADTYTIPGELVPVRQHTTTLLFVVAGSTSLSTIRRTLRDLRETIPIR